MPISREAIQTNQPFALYICANRYIGQNFCLYIPSRSV